MEFHNQHWIPESYLSAWCDPQTPQNQTPYVWKYSKDGKVYQKKAPKNIFCESEMYTIQCADGSRDLKLEHALSDLENGFAKIKQNKLSSKLPLSAEEKILICYFVAAMHAKRWSGFLGQGTGKYKCETAPGSSCRNLSLRVCAEVNHGRGFPVKGLMPSLVVVEGKVIGQSVLHLRY